MAILKMGLRNKAMAALVLVLLIILIPATLITWQAFKQVHKSLAAAYAENLAELNRYKIRAPVDRELVLSQQFAKASFSKAWFADESNSEKADIFFDEAQSYMESFRDKAYFAIHAKSKNYYFNELGSNDKAPDYQLSESNPDDGWFFNIIKDTRDYNINVNPDLQLGTTRVWFNIPVKDQNGSTLGMIGTGLDLTRFVDDLLQTGEVGVTTMALDQEGYIQAHPDASLIAFGSGAGLESEGKQVFELLADKDRDAAKALLGNSNPDAIQLLDVTVNNQPHILVTSYIPELNWYVASLINLNVAEVVSERWLYGIMFGVVAVILLIIVALAFAVQRMLIQPLSRLQSSANALAKGQYDVSLPVQSTDEIGDLSRAFAQMVKTIQSHTNELESKVSARTRELENSNREIELINKMVNDSIDYARLIQQAILPDLVMQRCLPGSCCVVWHPRDTVGGDFYAYHQADKQHLVAIVDCAGHGVPGALMTMLARAALDHAVREHGLDSPAKILQKMDEVLRGMLLDLELPRGLATNMDAGLAIIDAEHDEVKFSGAKLSLYAWRNDELTQYKGARRPLVGRRVHTFTDTVITDCKDTHFYMTTDGYLDQPGGDHGYGLRLDEFADAIRQANALSLPEQDKAIMQYLNKWTDNRYEQRDDICVIGFTIPPTK
ncbi:biofilm regulation protein phosphatase SiaA [Methylophaga sp. OBS3]|uniref:biofilm regulation protein phosphatase SiaA n=1 Tax=Methylophaga sp. OBS3 TaxID=2991934 RepID=UPI00224E3F84|nr:biofilm regulation protein phosphatase SiaA [Methylophaga sp. OBS3]MCX4189425.1 biofilm regulation protein phosphatase SiaA [Methylophaga sp. OBS3]